MSSGHSVLVREEALTHKALDGEIIDFRITEENEGFLYGDLVEKKAFIQ